MNNKSLNNNIFFWKTIWGKFTLLLIGFIVFVLAMDKIIMPVFTRHGDTSQIEDLTDLDTTAVKEKLDEIGLVYVNEDSQYSEIVKSGNVLMQRPLPGAQIKEGRRVYITYSMGKRPLFMPDLTARGFREGQLLIKQLGLNLGEIVYRYSSTIKKGTISSQSVPPADPISPGQYVRLTVSKGASPDKQLVPEIVNRPLKHALKLLEMVGLPVDTIIYIPSSTSIPDIVFEQSLAPGTIVKPGDQIILKVAKNR